MGKSIRSRPIPIEKIKRIDKANRDILQDIYNYSSTVEQVDKLLLTLEIGYILSSKYKVYEQEYKKFILASYFLYSNTILYDEEYNPMQEALDVFTKQLYLIKVGKLKYAAKLARKTKKQKTST